MKDKLFFLLMATAIAINANGQRIVQNDVDDFTGNIIKRSSYETLVMSFDFTSYVRVSKINDSFFLDMKMVIGSGVFSIPKDGKLIFKLGNGELLELNNLEYAVTCAGCASKGTFTNDAQGIKVSYPMSKEQMEQLIIESATKIRIYTNDGYVENGLKSKNYKKLQSALKMVI